MTHFAFYFVQIQLFLLFLFRLTLDFQINKKIAEEVALIPSKRIRNKVAGFITVRTPQTCAVQVAADLFLRLIFRFYDQ